MERPSLSIRQFAEACGVSHTEIGRKMKALKIKGNPQGPGKPTLLSPADQDVIAGELFTPATAPTAPAPHVEVVGAGMSVYQPQQLATRGTDSGLARGIQQQQLSQSLQAFKGNNASFRDALLGMASEQGRQLGHEMAIAQMSAALSTFDQMQRSTGKELGIVDAAGGESA